MRLFILPLLAALNLCGTSGGERGSEPIEPYQGPGWSLQLSTVGAKVEAEPDQVSFDLRDFSRWFDVRWVDHEVDLSIVPRREGSIRCDPAVWDRAIVEEQSWTAGGLCTRGSRFWWMVARIERHERRDLFFFYVANPDFLAFEDAWVDFSRTVATFGGTDTPPEPPSARELRAAIRAASTKVRPTASPLPGSGVLSSHVIEHLGPVWAMRRERQPPAPRLDGSEAEPEAQELSSP
ncbi:MAG: hypothetical protein EA397_00885 [Deltaproteobacteria bacterium]|nr:MAG: hypothetical protein EA397_00885 [Deltaproteobacteria bacterium]